MDDSNINETSLLIPRTGVPHDQTDKRRPYERQLAIYIILASTALERLAFYSLIINLATTLHLSEVHWDTSNGVTASFIFFGTSYISTLIFAALSDAKLGRGKTIIVGFLVYLIGYLFILLIANTTTHVAICGYPPSHNQTDTKAIGDEHCAGPFIATLIVTAIGVGAVQSNIAVFGAEQAQEHKGPSRFFDKYVIAINIGGIFATILVPYIQFGQSDLNRFFFGYLFAGVLLVGAIILFIVGYRFYLHVKPFDTIITQVFPVIFNAFQSWLKYKKDKRLQKKHERTSSKNLLEDSMTDSKSELESLNGSSISFLDFARYSNNGRFTDSTVNDVKSLRRVIIVFLLLIPYWLVYYQIQTTFLLQGENMRIPTIITNVTNTEMVVTWMSVGDQLTIISGIIILNLFIYKYLANYDRSTVIQIKFVIGMILASITMFIAGTLENIRQRQCRNGIGNSNLSIFTQLPQYIGMGFSEVFGMVASYEFAYLAAPRSAQSLIMSLRFFSLGLSSFISDAYVRLITVTLKKFDFDCQNSEQILYYYFFILGGIQLLTTFIFILCSRKSRILQLDPSKSSTNQFI